MPQKQHPLYFIAIIPTSSVREELQGLKELFRDKYSSKASLNSPPHITLHMPFKFSDKKKERMLKSLTNVAAHQERFEVELKNFSAFTPRVIYADIVENEALKELQRSIVEMCRVDLKLLNANYKNQAYHPHITLAFRDLKKPAFAEAWKEFENKKYNARFLVNSFSLLKHDGSKWSVDTEFSIA
ncbi:2'-5' RNA ligase [Owenweeksia hongkongensis DSM 17368]|uniref:2'-5' RNA ligase n=1 Tax=Owenweeksia hongkongensis (strain DSM 17368 / CIP 108786 / JCM 12287 / NRRL B-23963 / UST20020801) TaxID=926562 RepID=G8R4D7_OWEHD|nr:2'-5' RNA ligase family protein [Owenweeksia hongkongensis]AEV34237.1 2'-5' RNA ligase [Owenweeksia hongkongensis DSM 17368]